MVTTWSIAGKWLLTNEGFMSQFADNGHYVSVRGSYGIQGNIHDDATPNLILEVGNRNTTSNLDQSTITVCLTRIYDGKKRLLGMWLQISLFGMEGFQVVWMCIKSILKI